LIHLFVEYVLNAAVSLRGASACLDVTRRFLPGVDEVPTPNCGQMWLLRIGLHELTRPKEKADDWVWIVDHTIQIGTVKCLVVAGCRLSRWQEERRPLEHHDLELLALEPVKKSNGEIVNEQLEKVALETGVPRSIVSDHGTDLKRGIETFEKAHPETDGVYDIAHKAARLVKRELEADERWSEFLKQFGKSKQRLQQTSLAFLTPPTPKNKARYMNVEELVRWGRNALRYLENPLPIDGEPPDIPKLNEKLGWLSAYAEAFDQWDAMMRVVTTTRGYIRHEGYHREARRELSMQLGPLATDSLSRRIADLLLVFVQEQSARAKPGERLIGSSECLESLIGKGKRLEGQQSKSGFTKMILAMSAAVVDPTVQYIEQALTHVKTPDVVDWCRKQLGISVQSQRRLAFAYSTNGTKTG
jgi:hypothetical protein